MKSALHKFTAGFAGVVEDTVVDAAGADGLAKQKDSGKVSCSQPPHSSFSWVPAKMQ